MNITRFDATGDIIVVPTTLWSPDRTRFTTARMALDTGAAETIITPDVTDELGYGAHLGDHITVIHSVVGREHGYTMRVTRFTALGFDQLDFLVVVQDVPSGYGIEGLLGLSFLRHFDYDIRSLRGELHVRPASLA